MTIFLDEVTIEEVAQIILLTKDAQALTLFSDYVTPVALDTAIHLLLAKKNRMNGLSDIETLVMNRLSYSAGQSSIYDNDGLEREPEITQ